MSAENRIDVTATFDDLADDYDLWFDRHPDIFKSELSALKKIVPERGRGLEIGVGTGRFAEKLGIKYGVEPAASMRTIAKKRGIQVVEGIAESLPFPDDSFDYAAMITTLCFVKDPLKSLEEAKRVLKPGGQIIIGIIDRESRLGKRYEGKKEQNPYYRSAHFFSVPEVLALLKRLGFQRIKTFQTLFEPHEGIKTTAHLMEGYGQGGFVAISADKNS